MSLTAVEQQQARNLIARARLKAVKDERPTKPTPAENRAPQTVIEAQIDALHFTLVKIDAIVIDCQMELANIKAQLTESRVTRSWLNSERHILELRRQVNELRNEAA